MTECRRLDAPCIVVAGSGLLVLLAVWWQTLVPFIPASVSLVALGIALHRLEAPRTRYTVTLLVVGSWMLSVAYARGLLREDAVYAGVSMSYAAAALALAAGAEAGLSVFASSYAPLMTYFNWSPYAMILLSVGFVLLGGMIASLSTGRFHIILAVLLVPIFTIFGPQTMTALALLTFMTVLSVSGTVEWRTCPFRVDSGMVMIGSLISVTGALLMSLGELLWLQSLALYSLGLLLILAGLLSPVSPARRELSLRD